MMNRSAKACPEPFDLAQDKLRRRDGARSSLHYGGEGDTHPPIVPRACPEPAEGCRRAARYGRFERDPRRTRRVSEWRQDKRPYKSETKWEAMPGE